MGIESTCKQIMTDIENGLQSVFDRCGELRPKNGKQIKEDVVVPAYRAMIKARIIKDNDAGWEECLRSVYQIMKSMVREVH